MWHAVCQTCPCRLLLKTGRCAGQTLQHSGGAAVMAEKPEEPCEWLLVTITVLDSLCRVLLQLVAQLGVDGLQLVQSSLLTFSQQAGQSRLHLQHMSQTLRCTDRNAQVLMLQHAGLGCPSLQHMNRALQHMTASECSNHTWYECGLGGRCIGGWGVGQ